MMDNFMDQMIQRFNSQDMIRANAAADAAELESLEKQMTLFREQMNKYDTCLQEMRRLSAQSMENAQGVRQLADSAGEQLGKTAEQVEAVSVSKINETSQLSIEGINKTVDEGLAKIAEIQESSGNLEGITEAMTELLSKQEEMFRGLEDYLHTDNVKVYRNVQASMIEELEKQTTELKAAQEKAAKSGKVLLPFMIVTMIFTIANLIIMVARILGLF